MECNASLIVHYNNQGICSDSRFHFSLPEPEPLRHNVSNYLQAAKGTAAKGLDVEHDEDNDGVDQSSGDIFITRESEVGPEVTHIYQIENKVP